jgi:hypothetical protein
MTLSSAKRTRALKRNTHSQSVFPVEDIHKAIEAARHSPQYRIPHGRQGGPWKVLFPSQKARKTFGSSKDYLHILEGRLEADYCLSLEFDTDVEVYACQPCKLIGGRDYGFTSFTPDHIVFPNNAPAYVVDCKPKQVAEAKIHRERHAILRQALAAQRVEFRVVTDEAIRVHPRMDTYRLLYGFLSAPEDYLAETQLAVERELQNLNGTAQMKDLRHLDQDVARRGTACGLVSGSILADYSTPFGPNFEITLV